MRLLVSDSDTALLRTLCVALKADGYSVDGVCNAADVRNYLACTNYDGVVLSYTLTGINGLEVLERIRHSDISCPVLFMSPCTDAAHRIEALDAGADDCLSKPFATEELAARVRAMMRRRDTYTPRITEYRGLRLDAKSHSFSCGGRTAELTHKEFQVMELLMDGAGGIVPSSCFFDSVWDWDSNPEPNALCMHMTNLRKKLKQVGAPVAIRFKRGAGYYLDCAK